jgi:hypothetical protein
MFMNHGSRRYTRHRRSFRPIVAGGSRGPNVERLEDRQLLAAFTPGDLVIERIGDGAGSLLNTGNAVFLDEYTTAGALVQSIALPTTSAGSSNALISSGVATSEGALNLSPNGQFLTLAGYDTSPGGATSLASTTSTAVPRSVAIVNALGQIDTSTALTDWASANNPRSAVTTDGNALWVGGAAGGVRATTAGSSTSTQLSTTVVNIRVVNIFGGQLYASDSSGSAVRLGAVGTGLPTTSGQTIVNLPGFPTAGSPYGYFFTHLNGGAAGLNTVYVADDTPGTIQKYSLISGTWTAEGTAAAAAVRGLTGTSDGTTVTLFGTTGASGATGGGSLYTFADTTGFSGSISGTASSIATAAANTVFRGVAFAPQNASQAPAITLNPADTTVTAGQTATFTAAASGTPTPTVQWQLSTNGGSTFNDVSGATSTTLSFSATAAMNGNEYRAVFTNAAGSATTTAATLTVNVAPAVTTNPADQSLFVGDVASFTAAASGRPNPSVQWQMSTNGGATFNDISGATSTTLSFTATTAVSGNQYRAVFTNSVGSATTTAASLSVQQAVVATTGVSWGTAGSAALQTAGDGLRLLAQGRSIDLPWMNINKINITLNHAEPLSPADVVVTGMTIANYGPVTISGSGATYTITLAQPISAADRVTVTIGNGGVAAFTRRIDVLPGDVNDDGFVSVQDATVIRNQILGFAGATATIFGDIDGNGVVDMNDYNASRARIGTKLPTLPS